MKTKKAFTLVELLVVISIIAILLAILMPALSKVREQGRMVVCRANEKTLVLAATLWSGDNDGWAIAGDWYKPYHDIVGGQDLGAGASSLEKYTNCSYKSKNLVGAVPTTSGSNKPQTSMVCPSAVNVKFIVHDPPDYAADSKVYSYASNGWITFNRKGPGRAEVTGRDSGGWIGVNDVYWKEHGFNKMTDIRRPNETAFFIDHQYYATMSWTFDPEVDFTPLRRSGKGSNVAPLTMPCETRWHTSRKDKNGYGIGNIGWVDGHVSVEPADFKTGSKWTYYFWNH